MPKSFNLRLIKFPMAATVISRLFYGAGDGSLPFPFGNPRQGGASLARTAGPPHLSPQTNSTPIQGAVCLEQVTGVGPAEISLGS